MTIRRQHRSSKPVRTLRALPSEPHTSATMAMTASFNQIPSIGMVDADPVRAWLRFLIDQTHLPWRVIALAADLPYEAVYELGFGEGSAPGTTIPRRTARALLRITVKDLDQLSMISGDVDALRHYVHYLMILGCSPIEISHYLKLPASRIGAICNHANQWVTKETVLRAQAAYDAYKTHAIAIPQAG